MKKFNKSFFGFVVTLAAVAFSPISLAGDGCYLCKSDSKDGIQQCKYHGSDSQDQRKECEKAGCKIGGTASCSTAANIKVIDPN